MLEIFERGVQLLYLVLRMYLWQLSSKVAIGYLLGYVGELLYGCNGFTYSIVIRMVLNTCTSL